ncbi:T9SS type A sorting domain-containing protein [Chryseobacterium populi]|uniref:Por secretion system C-terminal sorting domain containing protein n=1 Tax=Chryseobacterium populi TaxID=1144316 RepID=J2TD39_9FLAO|nr:T9SS type A sorting domain-containing protein [Chryseobacterium populi]EJL76092.1 Por secretion system C-terminal sorting domain containing protein [Chryseobacterium populi]
MKITIFSLYLMLTSLSTMFNAQCNAVNVPYVEDFNTTATGDIPTCTSRQLVSGAVEWQAYDYDGTLMVGDAGPNPETWFYTQGVNLQAGNVYKLTFDYFGISVPQSFAVAYGTSPVNSSMTNVIQEFLDFPSGTPPVSASLTINPPATGIYYFGFNYKGGGSGVLVVDNVSVLESNLSSSEVQHLKDAVEIYPNPAKDYLLVKNSKKNTGAEILDVSGKVVFSLTGIKEKIDVSELIRGSYFLVIKNEDGTISKTKFIKK